MPRAMRVCTQPGCPELCEGGRCDQHRKEADRARGTARQRGYGSGHWRTQRRACLRRDLFCKCTDGRCLHGAVCVQPATVADHYPRSRKELIAAGVRDPDALEHLRGLCKGCHDRSTATLQPGGWNVTHSD